jgi:hypothetical protein
MVQADDGLEPVLAYGLAAVYQVGQKEVNKRCCLIRRNRTNASLFVSPW